jgi:CRP/FNR family cyclic AMP-dependent transcriptional regulator
MGPSIDQHLGRVPLFAELSKKQLAKVSGLTTQLSVPAGTRLITEGAVGKEFILIVDGEAQVLRGEEKVATCGPGDYFGEVALLSDRRRTASVEALTDMCIEVIEGQDFRVLIADDPKIAEPVQQAMADRVADLDPEG